MADQKILMVRRYLITFFANLIIFFSVMIDLFFWLPAKFGVLIAAILSFTGMICLLFKRFKLFKYLTLIAVLIWCGCLIYTIIQDQRVAAM